MNLNILDQLLPCGFEALVQPLVIKFISDGKLGSESFASAIRDGIGRGLNRLAVCGGGGNCECAYCLYFKPTSPPGSAGSISPGFILETSSIHADIAAGSVAGVNLILIGRAGNALPWFLSAMLHCGQIGIGEPRARFTVDTSGPAQRITSDDITDFCTKHSSTRTCEIRLISPLILNDKGKPTMELSFQRHLRAVIERIQPNIGYWCGGKILRNKERDSICSDILDLAGSIPYTFHRDSIIKETSIDYQGNTDSLTGFTGSLHISGELDTFLPLLAIGQILHIGQRPNLDRGRYELLFH